MTFISYLIAGIFSFFCFWLSTVIFDSKLENKVARSAILAGLTFAVSLIFDQLGDFGFVIAFIINFILLMKILRYNFISALLFILGLNLLSAIVFLGLFNIFPNNLQELPEKKTSFNSITTDDLSGVTSKDGTITKGINTESNSNNLKDVEEKYAYTTYSDNTNSDDGGFVVSEGVKIDRKELDGEKLWTVPRIMMWSGKVNQHWDLEKGLWLTDPDGSSGSREDKLTYCKKFYPNSISVSEYKNETISTWRARGNQGSYTATAMSYRCILNN